MPPTITVDMSTVMEEFSKLRTELGGKLDAINAHLASFVLKSDHEKISEDIEGRVRNLEGFKAWTFGAMAAVGTTAGVLGALVALALKALGR